MNKKNLFYLLAPALFFIASCGGGEETPKDGETKGGEDELNLDGMAADDTLMDHGLNTVIWVPEQLAPDGTQVPSEIEADPDNMIWKIKSGKKFCVVIRVVDGEGDYIKRKKAELDGSIFKVEYIDEGENYILYKATLPEKASQAEFYKFYGVKKAAGEEYEYYNDESIDLRKVDAENIKKSFSGFGEEIIE